VTVTGVPVAMDAAASSQQRMAKLADGAQQFEAMMLQQMLKPLKFGESPDSGGDDENTGGVMQGYGTEALAKSISSHGGFGIAKQIIRQVTAEDHVKGSHAGGAKVP